jgi:hypothetical protein
MGQRGAFKVFVTGDLGEHERAAQIQAKLLGMGMAAILPDRLRKHAADVLMVHDGMAELDRAWVSCCDAMLVLPGTSESRRLDMDCAFERIVPRFKDLGKLAEYYHGTGVYD